MACIVINFFTRERLNTGEETSADNVPPKENKRKSTETSDSVKQFFQESLDNDRVKAKYKLNPRK